MSLQAEIIPITLPSPAGASTFTVNHVRYPSLQGKAFIFFAADNTGTNSEIYSVGFDDGTTHIGNGIGITDSFGICTARGFSDATYSLITEQAQAFFGGFQRRLSGYVSAISIGSFDITLDLNNTPGAPWFVVVIGGDDVSCKVGSYDLGLGSGNVTVGFEPIALLKLGVAADGEVAGADHAFGFATLCASGTTDQAAWGITCDPGALGASYQLPDIIGANITSAGVGPTSPVTISSWAASGFNVGVSGTPGWDLGYLAIGGDAVSANLVAITQPTSTGIQNTAIDASDPVLVFFGSTCKVSSASPSVDTNVMLGAYDGASNMSQWWGHVNNTGNRDRLSSTTKAITLATSTGVSTSTVNATASCTLASGNIALNWTTVDATQREVWALVLAQNLSGTSNPCGDNPQASITVIKHATPIPGGATDFPFGTSGLTPSTFTLQDGGSQLFAGLSPGTYGITETAPQGWTASYAVSNGDPHGAIVITGTEAVTVTVSNTFGSSTETFRVLRRWALPYDGNKKIFIPRIEIIAQMGVGNASSTDPVMYLRISPDGGETWGAYRQMPLGAAGDTMIRAYLTRFCQGLRNPVAELICDDPVFVGWVACELPQDFTVGTS